MPFNKILYQEIIDIFTVTLSSHDYTISRHISFVTGTCIAALIVQTSRSVGCASVLSIHAFVHIWEPQRPINISRVRQSYLSLTDPGVSNGGAAPLDHIRTLVNTRLLNYYNYNLKTYLMYRLVQTYPEKLFSLLSFFL